MLKANVMTSCNKLGVRVSCGTDVVTGKRTKSDILNTFYYVGWNALNS